MLNGTYVYRHKHNYIPCSTFTITKVQLHVSTINVGHLQVVHEELINKLYQLTQQCILEKLYYLWTKSKVLLYYIHSFTYLHICTYQKCNPLLHIAVSSHKWYFNTIPKTAPVHTPFSNTKRDLPPPTPQTVNFPHMLV